MKKRLSSVATAVAAMLLALLGGLAAVTFLRKNVESVRRVVLPLAPPVEDEKHVIMGAIAMPTPAPEKDPKEKKDTQKMDKPARRVLTPAA